MRKSNLKNIIIGLLPLILANIYLIISGFGHNDFLTPILISNNILIQCIYLIFLGYAVATDDKLTKIKKKIVEDISVRVLVKHLVSLQEKKLSLFVKLNISNVFKKIKMHYPIEKLSIN